MVAFAIGHCVMANQEIEHYEKMADMYEAEVGILSTPTIWNDVRVR